MPRSGYVAPVSDGLCDHGPGPTQEGDGLRLEADDVAAVPRPLKAAVDFCVLPRRVAPSPDFRIWVNIVAANLLDAFGTILGQNTEIEFELSRCRRDALIGDSDTYIPEGTERWGYVQLASSTAAAAAAIAEPAPVR